MIQLYLKEKLMTALPSLNWSIDFKTENDNTGAVYYEGGSKPGAYDVPNRFPRYMVYLSSSDWQFAEFAAMKSLEILHKTQGDTVAVEYTHDNVVVETKHFYIQWIEAAGDINPVGIDNNVMDYSVNFDVRLIEIKGET